MRFDFWLFVNLYYVNLLLVSQCDFNLFFMTALHIYCLTLTPLSCFNAWSFTPVQKTETTVRKCLSKYIFFLILQYLQYSQENTCKPAILLKRDSKAGVFLWILIIFLRITFFTEHLRWVLLKIIFYFQKKETRSNISQETLKANTKHEELNK